MAFSEDGDVIDRVLLSLRWWGPYQQIQFLMTILPVLACALHAMSVIFIGRAVKHTCAPVDSLNISLQENGIMRNYDVINDQSHNNLTVTYGACSIDVKNGTDVVFTTNCISGFKYEEPADRSFVSQWDLVCERTSLSDVSQSMLALGMMIGAFVFTALSDRYGRKPVYMFTHICLFIVAGAIAFSPNYITFIVLRFLLGGFQQGMGLTSNIMLVEMLPKGRRSLPSEVGNFVWVGSLMALSLISYLMRDISWQYSELIFAACSVYVLFQWWVTDESLRWLVRNNRPDEVERILKKAARANKVEYQTVLEVLQGGRGIAGKETVNLVSMATLEEVQVKVCEERKISGNNETSTSGINGAVSTVNTDPQEEMRLLAFVKNKRVLMITVISCYIWFTDSVTYYGLLLTSSSLAENLYLGVFLSVVAELPTGVVFIFFIDRIGRKRCLAISHCIAAISLMIATILSNLSIAENVGGIKVIILVVSLLGKFGISCAFSVLWLYSAELFPTNLRNTAFGVSSLAARIGGMVAPYSRTFSSYLPWGPGAVFTCLCILVPLVLRLLPETAGQELPETLADLDKWFEHEKKPSVTGKKS